MTTSPQLAASAPLGHEPESEDALHAANPSAAQAQPLPEPDLIPPDTYDGEVAAGNDIRIADYAAMPGMPGRGVVLLSLLAVGACAGLDLALTRGITLFFDLCFVVVCLVAAMAVRRRDLFTTGVLPPLLFAIVVAGVALISPAIFVQVGGVLKAFMTGLAQHAAGLVSGYVVALVTVASRVSASRVR